MTSVPIVLMVRTSASPRKKLKTGAPWKQSPPIEVEHAVGARALAVDDVREPRDAADVDVCWSRVPRPSPASTWPSWRLYGKSGEWMSAVWSSVRCTSQVCPSGQADWGPLPPDVHPGVVTASSTTESARANAARRASRRASTTRGRVQPRGLHRPTV